MLRRFEPGHAAAGGRHSPLELEEVVLSVPDVKAARLVDRVHLAALAAVDRPPVPHFAREVASSIHSELSGLMPKVQLVLVDFGLQVVVRNAA